MGKVLVFSGPTGVGKTSFAIQVAKHYGTEIISTDSRQIFSELNIGVARPSIDELAEVPHHFIASHSIHEPITAGIFLEAARARIQELFKKHEVVVVVGGSMLYTDALLYGLDDLPSDKKIKEKFEVLMKEKGISFLQAQLEIQDQEYFLEVDKHNPHRLIRALEVMEITKVPFSQLRGGEKEDLNAEAHYFFLNRDRAELYNRINARVLQMFENGLVKEVESLRAYAHLNALNTVGYKEVFSMLKGELNEQSAIELIQQHTRNYAKRQMTWYRNRTDIKSLDLSNLSVTEFLNEFL
ncbi:MAG: tRNA (adenosine(37)-N6)-dimethylallyltransferase MiaA [Bacteroidetes bacterium]|nr:tRNA (adenosine(37)-N6)-dimethylallyltransferase MiaA [Bacteroidota bacterium]